MSAHISHLPPGPSAYTNHKCRCDECRAGWAGWADYIWNTQQARAKTLGEPWAPQPEHGRASTYGNWRCRCRPCTDAFAAASRERRARRKEKTSRG